MIVNHVHDNADAVIMKRFYHLFHFFDSDLAIVRIGRVRAFRHIVVDRVISPVKLRRIKLRLIYRTVIIDGEQMKMRDSQIFDMIKTRRDSGRGRRSRLSQSEIFSGIGDSG